MTPGKDNPKFVASRADLSRAEAISDAEYARLVEEMQSKLMPVLATAAALLAHQGFSIVKLDCSAGLSSLVIRSRRPTSIRAWIYFQVHRSFGPLISNERVFWMYAVQAGSEPQMGKPGRLQDLSDIPAVTAIVGDYVSLCERSMR